MLVRTHITDKEVRAVFRSRLQETNFNASNNDCIQTTELLDQLRFFHGTQFSIRPDQTWCGNAEALKMHKFIERKLWGWITEF